MGGGVKSDLMLGATATDDGAAGLVPAPGKGTPRRFLRSDGIWTPADGGDADTVDGFHASKENIIDTTVVRGSDGSVQLGRIVSDTENNEDPSVSQIIVTNGSDDIYRKSSLSNIKASMGLGGVGGAFFGGEISVGSANRGYVNFLQISKSSIWGNHPSLLYLLMRGCAAVKVLFSPANGTVSDVKTFVRSPIVKGDGENAINSFDIYMTASSPGGEKAIFEFYMEREIYSNISGFGIISHPHIFKTVNLVSLPIGCITPTEVSYIP